MGGSLGVMASEHVRTLGRPHRDQVGVRVTDRDGGSGPLRHSDAAGHPRWRLPLVAQSQFPLVNKRRGAALELISFKFHLRDLAHDALTKLVPYTCRKKTRAKDTYMISGLG